MKKKNFTKKNTYHHDDLLYIFKYKNGKIVYIYEGEKYKNMKNCGWTNGENFKLSSISNIPTLMVYVDGYSQFFNGS